MHKKEQGIYNRQDLDYRVNHYTIKCQIVMLIVMAAIWITNILNIFVVDQKLMACGMIFSALPVLITLIVSRVVDIHKSWVKYFMLFNLILAITVLGMILTYHTVLLSVFPLLIAVQYIDKRTVAYAYILTIISVFTIVMGGYYYGLCDANMLLLTTEKTSYYMDALTYTVSFDLLNTNPWVTLPLFYVLPRCIILLVFLPVIWSIYEHMMDYVDYAADMKLRSETDEMTGLYNKNKYLDMMDKYYPKVENVSVIFWDINGLKITNDTLGHAQGDSLIETASGCVKALTSNGRKGYRVGGDEFVMVIENPKEGELEHVIEKWDQVIRECNKSADVLCSVAIGTASGAGKDIEKVAKEADKKMYQRKKEQKSNNIRDKKKD